MKRTIGGLVCAAIALHTHADDDTKFYRQPVYMLVDAGPGIEACEKEESGVPSGLWGNRERVETTQTVSPTGQALTIIGTYEDGTVETYRFFLKRVDCMKATASYPNAALHAKPKQTVPGPDSVQPPCGAVLAHGWIVGDSGFGFSPIDLIERTRHSKPAEQQRLMGLFPFTWHPARPLPFCTGVAEVNSVRIVTLPVNANLLTRYGRPTLRKYLYGVAQIPMNGFEANCAVLTPRESAECTADR